MDPRPDQVAATPTDLRAERPGPRLGRLLATCRWPALALVLYTAAALGRFAGAWTAPGSRSICGCGDAAFTMWFLRWAPYAVAQGLSPFFTTWLNVPDGVNAMWNVNFFLPGLLVSPVTMLGGPVLAYNVLSVAAFALSAFTAFLVFRRWAPWPPAAFAGGLLFGFSPFMTAQGLGHLHMTLGLFLPLLLLAFDELLVRQRGRWLAWGGLLGLVSAAQLLTSEEVLAGSALVGGVTVLLLLALNPRGIRRRAGYAALGLGTALVVFLALTAWPLYVQFAGPQRLTGAVQQSERFSVDAVAPLVPTGLMRFAPMSLVEVARHFSGNRAENGGYLGLPLLLVLVAVVVLCRRRGVVRFAGVALVATFVLSLGRHLHVAGDVSDVGLPLGLLRDVPLLESVVASRLSLHVTLFAGLLLAVGLDRLHAAGRDRSTASSFRRWVAVAAPLAVAVAALLPLLPARPYGAQPVGVPEWFRSASVQRVPAGSALLTVPLPGRADSRPMLWQAVAGMRYRSPGGYVLVPDARGRPRWGAPSATGGRLSAIRSGRPLRPINPFQLQQLRSDLSRWQIRTVVIPVDGMAHWADAMALFTTVLGRSPVRDHDAYVWYGVDPAALR